MKSRPAGKSLRKKTVKSAVRRPLKRKKSGKLVRGKSSPRKSSSRTSFNKGYDMGFAQGFTQGMKDGESYL